MIKLTDKGIRWEREDVRVMAKLIGSEFAVISARKKYRYAPPLGSLMKLIERKGLPMSKRARMELQVLEMQRKNARSAKKLEAPHLADSPGSEKWFAHQRADVFFMRAMNKPSYLLAHEPGVGKTLEAIMMAAHWEAQRVGVITTNNAKEQWRDEIKRWSPQRLPIHIVEGTVKEQEHTLRRKRGWIIGHWESLVHARDGWKSKPWDLIIGDEAHHIQNRNAQRTETIFDIETAHALALSGHPFANRLGELWPILRFLYPRLYPSFWRWAHLQIEIDPGAFGGLDLTTPRRPALLRWELETFTIRRTKREVWPNLPAITRRKQIVYLGPRAREEYERLKRQFFVELEGHRGEKNILAIPSVLARITRLRQYLIDPSILGSKQPSVKYAAIKGLLNDVAKPTVIFTTFRTTALNLHAYLKKCGYKTDYIVGGMSKRTNKVKRKFLRGKLHAVIIMIKVGGTALNFGKYGYVIGLDFPWNPKDLEQPEGRVDRPEEGTGKQVPTTADWLCVKDSYEERMMQKIMDKHADFSKVFTVSGAKELFK